MLWEIWGCWSNTVVSTYTKFFEQFWAGAEQMFSENMLYLEVFNLQINDAHITLS